MLEDGTYDAIVVDASDGAEPGSVLLELAIAGGPHRGEVLSVTVRTRGRDLLDLLAVPATITVTDGAPRVVLEG